MTRDQRQVLSLDRARSNRGPQDRKRLDAPCDEQRAGSSIVEAMDQTALNRLIANKSDLGKSRHHRVHHSAALPRPQRMTWNAAGLVHDHDGCIFEENL